MNRDMPEGIVLPLVAPPYETYWELGGCRYVVRVWTPFQWERTRMTDRPRTAQPIGGDLGWMNIEPIPD